LHAQSSAAERSSGRMMGNGKTSAVVPKSDGLARAKLTRVVCKKMAGSGVAAMTCPRTLRGMNDLQPSYRKFSVMRWSHKPPSINTSAARRQHCPIAWLCSGSTSSGVTHRKVTSGRIDVLRCQPKMQSETDKVLI
jgi:hypothetical protein